MLKRWPMLVALVAPIAVGAIAPIWISFAYRLTRWLLIGGFGVYLILATMICVFVIILWVPLVPYSKTAVASFERATLIAVVAILITYFAVKHLH